MKIAFFHELPYGGARRAVLEFGKQLKKDHIIDLYYLDEKKEKGVDEIFQSVFLTEFHTKIWTGNNWKAKLYKDTLELYNLYKLHKQLAQKIDQKGYDFVFVHGSKYTQAPFILRFLQTKNVYYCQEPLRMVYEELFDRTASLPFGKKIYERTTRKIRKVIDRQNVQKTRILLANSKYTKSNIRKAYNLDATVCYMGVDTKIFYPEKLKKKYDVLFIGSMEEIDGYSLLRDAIKLMKIKPEVRYVLRENEWITDDSTMRKLYSEAKLLTCLGYKEPFGLLPIEAQACGIPVVAINEGGYRDTVQSNRTGVLIKRDAKLLSQVIEELLYNTKRLQEYGERAYKNVQDYWTWQKSAENLLHIVESRE